MKKTILLLGLTLCLIAISCNRENPVNAPVNDGQSNTFVSMDQAEEEVLKLVSIVDGNTKGRQSRRIAERFSLGGPNAKTKSEDCEDPLVYVFNFEDEQGFALASGDNRMPPVLCLTDEGTLTDTTSINEGALAMLSIIDTDYRMAVGLPITDYDGNTVTSEQYAPAVDFVIDDEGGFGGGSSSSTYTSYTSWTNTTPVGTRTATTWRQRSPFNKYCKTTDGKEAYAGCVAIAVGQIMYYWGKNATYNGHYYDWSAMGSITDRYVSTTHYSEAWNKVQLLLSDLGRSENLNMDYGEVDNSDGSFASCDNIKRTFNRFGYSNGGVKQDYNLGILKDNLLIGPVIGCGKSIKTVTKFLGITINTSYSGGHEWIYDQYMIQYRYRNSYSSSTGQLISSTKETRTLVRCNWGWGGRWDGYYLSGQYNTNSGADLITKSDNGQYGTDGFYQYKLKMHTGIHP